VVTEVTVETVETEETGVALDPEAVHSMIGGTTEEEIVIATWIDPMEVLQEDSMTEEGKYTFT
jgi:hypothetical protein